MFGVDRDGLEIHLKRLGFQVDFVKGRVIALKKIFSIEGNCIWVNNIEEMLYIQSYGYAVKNIAGVLIFYPLQAALKKGGTD